MILGRLVVPVDEHKPPHGRQPDWERMKAVMDTIAAHPGISFMQLSQMLNIKKGSVTGILLAMENHGILLAEDENGGLFVP